MSKDKAHTGLRKYDIKDVTASTTGTGLVVLDSTAWWKTERLEDKSWKIDRTVFQLLYFKLYDSQNQPQ